MTVPKPLVSLILISVLFFISCNVKKKSLIDELVVLDSVSKSNFSIADVSDSIMHKSILNNLVLEICSIKSFECGYVGYAGTKSTQPNYFSLLNKNASTPELIKLADHDNPYVRVCAFSNLTSRVGTDSIVRVLFKTHLNDTEMIEKFCGCEADQFPVNIEFYTCISSSLNKKDKDAAQKHLKQLYKDNLLFALYFMN